MNANLIDTAKIKSMRIGFTLIELLIVIAIIAILAAILFPVFATARETARGIACLSNMKQIGLAYAQYEQDYDETVPCGDWPTGGGAGWAGQVYTYVKSTAAFLCPDDTGPGDVVSYGVNANMVGYVTISSVNYVKPAQMSMMTAPAQCVMLYEVTNCKTPSSNGAWTVAKIGSSGGDWEDSPSGVGEDSISGANNCWSSATCTATTMKYTTGVMGSVCFDQTTTSGPTMNSSCNTSLASSYLYSSYQGIHNGGANYLMGDNHAKWLNPTQVSEGADTFTGTHSASCPISNIGLVAASANCAQPLQGTTAPQFTATFGLH